VKSTAVRHKRRDDTRFSDHHASAAAYVSFLIDGQKLAQYMIENELGVSLKQNYKIYVMDTDYFVEEE